MVAVLPCTRRIIPHLVVRSHEHHGLDRHHHHSDLRIEVSDPTPNDLSLCSLAKPQGDTTCVPEKAIERKLKPKELDRLFNRVPNIMEGLNDQVDVNTRDAFPSWYWALG